MKLKQNILITGATGFIGTNLCLNLLKKGHKIYAVDNFCSSYQANLLAINKFIELNHLDRQNFVFYQHDIINDFDKFNFDKIDFIYNLACPASPENYQKNPVFTFKTSIWGLENCINLALKHDATLVFTSTSEVYGDALEHPQKESYWGNVNPIGIRSCYDEGKRAGEAFLFSYLKTSNLKIKIVRIFNTYGPFLNPKDGRVVSNFIIQALNQQNITIYGDGSQTRSFCYIDDLIEILTKFSSAQDAFHGPLNIGNPNENNMLELANLIIQLTKSSSKIVYLPLPLDDPKQRKPDITLAQSKYQWYPHTNLSEGIKKTIEYFKNNA